MLIRLQRPAYNVEGDIEISKLNSIAQYQVAVGRRARNEAKARPFDLLTWITIGIVTNRLRPSKRF